MNERRRVALHLISAAMAAAVLVVFIDALTNSLDTAKFSWDFRYYIDMALRGLAPPLASPFAYRYLTPLLARFISTALEVDVEAGFGILARGAAVTQLLGVFLLGRWYSKSSRGAWVAMLAAAFSLYQVKFLLFDEFRPDHLAYPLILLQVYLALTGRFWPLLIATVIGCQIREFNAIPLVAWVAGSWWTARASASRADGHAVAMKALISGLALAAALILPRLLIPVAEDFQFASLTPDGLLRALLAPFILARDANYLYSLMAYVLPVMMLASPREALSTLGKGDPTRRAFLLAYGAFVLAFSFLGGTDFYRFSTYLLPLMTLTLAGLAPRRAHGETVLMLVAVLAFNRIWLPFPNEDVGSYLDFYGGSGSRFNLASLLRVVELLALMILGVLAGGFRMRVGGPTSMPAK